VPAAADGLYEQEVRIDATPDTVFDFLVEPEFMTQWMGTDAKLDARPGGVMRCDINGHDVAQGEYVVVERPHRVVMTWGWVGSDEMPPGSSTVEVTLHADGAATVLRLVHSRIPASQTAAHGEGWTHYLARLTIAATGADPGPDPNQRGV